MAKKMTKTELEKKRDEIVAGLKNKKFKGAAIPKAKKELEKIKEELKEMTSEKAPEEEVKEEKKAFEEETAPDEEVDEKDEDSGEDEVPEEVPVEEVKEDVPEKEEKPAPKEEVKEEKKAPVEKKKEKTDIFSGDNVMGDPALVKKDAKKPEDTDKFPVKAKYLGMTKPGKHHTLCFSKGRTLKVTRSKVYALTMDEYNQFKHLFSRERKLEGKN